MESKRIIKGRRVYDPRVEWQHVERARARRYAFASIMMALAVVVAVLIGVIILAGAVSRVLPEGSLAVPNVSR